MTLSTLDTLTEKMLDAGQIFSGTKTGTMVKGYAESSAYTPKVNPDYIFMIIFVISLSGSLLPPALCICVGQVDQEKHQVSANWPPGLIIPSLKSPGTTD